MKKPISFLILFSFLWTSIYPSISVACQDCQNDGLSKSDERDFHEYSDSRHGHYGSYYDKNGREHIVISTCDKDHSHESRDFERETRGELFKELEKYISDGRISTEEIEGEVGTVVSKKMKGVLGPKEVTFWITSKNINELIKNMSKRLGVPKSRLEPFLGPIMDEILKHERVAARTREKSVNEDYDDSVVKLRVSAEEAKKIAEKVKDYFPKLEPETQVLDPELNEIKRELVTNGSDSEDHKKIRENGIQFAVKADRARNQGNEEQYRLAKELAKMSADLLVGLDPVTGLLRDFFEFTTGKNAITGEKLNDLERAASGTLLAAGLFTGGLFTSAKNATKSLLKIGIVAAKHSDSIKVGSNMAKLSINNTIGLARSYGITTNKGVAVFESLRHGIQALPLGLEPASIYIGKVPGEVVVIGRSMKQSVEPAAEILRSQGLKVDIFEPSELARTQLNDKIREIGRHLTPREVETTRMYNENRNWIESANLGGKTIIDMGDPNLVDLQKGKSPFYEMEKATIAGGIND